MIAYFLGGCAIYGIVLFVLVMLRPKSALHTKKLTDCGRREKITIGVVLVILILLCTLPMGLAPGWNGEEPGATNQYELLAEAILNGHINITTGMSIRCFYRWTIRMIRRRVWISAWITAGIRRTIMDTIICILVLCRYFCCFCRSV